ncbi:MAG: ABC transporter permease [Clostridiales bacterium]|jgi:cell division transport system permease protein|nr:ABC transporter permease [Clostridiales bacterium]
MSAGSIGYLTKEGFRNVWVNRLMSIASIGILTACLGMVGLAFLGFINVQTLLDKVDDQNVIMVFVESDISEDEIKRVDSAISLIGNIDSVIYHSADDNSKAFYDEMSSELLVDYFNEHEANTIPASFEIRLKSMEQFDETLTKIKNISNIQYVRESRQLASFLVTLRKSVLYISIGTISLLLVVSLFIISNTVRITMDSRKLEISIMKNVGATNSFIKWPFMVEGMLLGAISGVLSLAAVYGIYELISKSLGSIVSVLDMLAPVPFLKYCLWLFLGFELIGIITGGLGSLISIKKYLKEKDYHDVAEEI